MTKDQAIKKAGTVKALAELLGVTTQAVYKWETIPPLRVYRLRELKPSWFRKSAHLTH